MADLGSLVESATSDVRMGLVDFGVNLEICDALERNPSEATIMVGAVKKRLGKSDAHVSALSLTLLEMCVKNCGEAVHAAVGQAGFLSDVAKLAEGSRGPEVQAQALALVQQWGVAFEPLKDKLPAFVDTYTGLKVKGLPFPEVGPEDAAPVFTPPRQDGAVVQDDAAYAAALADGSLDRAKLVADLGIVAEKIGLCNEMVPNSPGIEHDDALAEVVGFLEACRPRLAVLVEAGLSGALGDETLTLCLKVNDDLHKALQDEAESKSYKAPQIPAAPPPQNLLPLDLEDDEDDALSRATTPVVAPPPVVVPPPAPPAASAEPNLLDLDFAATPPSN